MDEEQKNNLNQDNLGIEESSSYKSLIIPGLILVFVLLAYTLLWPKLFNNGEKLPGIPFPITLSGVVIEKNDFNFIIEENNPTSGEKHTILINKDTSFEKISNNLVEGDNGIVNVLPTLENATLEDLEPKDTVVVEVQTDNNTESAETTALKIVIFK